jgi:hypothetical protein
VSQSLSKLLSLWSLSTPAFDAATLQVEIGDIQERLRQDGICQSIPGSRGWTCTDCDLRCPVEYVRDSQGKLQPYVHCQSCGVYQVDAALLARWKIDTPRLLEVLFCKTKLAIQERRPSLLWHVGRTTWAGRSREIWFVRSFRPSNATLIIDDLKSWPKAIVFTPTTILAEKIRAAISNLVISLDDVIAIRESDFYLDSDCIESRIQDREQSPRTKKPVSPKRATRLASSEKIKDELIAHLITARDYAYNTKETTGEALLLPRPLQKDLAQRAGLHVSAVSRCLKEKDSHELQLLWSMADNLDEVMKWVTPKKRGRKS